MSEADLRRLVARIGIYQEQSQRRRIVNELRQVTSRWQSLRAELGSYTAKGPPQQLLCVRGTIPISYGGSQYNVPLCIWLMAYFPTGGPEIFLEPTRSMTIDRTHRQVGVNGMVYLPELTTWNPLRSSLYMLIERMIAVFSTHPPLYSNVPSAVPPSQPQTHASRLHTDSRLLVTNVREKLRQQLVQTTEEARKEYCELYRSMDEMERTIITLRTAYEESPVLKDRAKLETFAAAHKEYKVLIEQDKVKDGDIPVENPFKQQSVLRDQHIEFFSEDVACQDALDWLASLVEYGKMGTDDFLKETRRVARQQFMIRAARIKVRDTQIADQKAALGEMPGTASEPPVKP